MTDSNATFLGLDLGTSGLRALLVDSQGNPITSAEAHYGSDHPHDGWSEQNPDAWIKACKYVFARLIQTHKTEMSALAGIATAGHMHGATLLDDQGNVLRPCILWNDTRSHKQAAVLDDQPDFREISGNIVFPGFTAPKLAWVKDNEPDIFAKTATVLLPKDYLSFWLTGQLVSDMSDAAGTSWLDLRSRNWSAPLVEQSGMRMDQMPKVLEGTDVVGSLRKVVAKDLGINPNTKVIAGAADNAAAACGIGALSDGQGFVSLGTSGVLLAGQSTCTPLPASAVHTFCHAVPDTWYQMGVILSATNSLNWLATLLRRTPEELSELLPDTLQAPSSAMFTPYLSGERTPHNDSAVRGSFSGLSTSTTPAQMVQAVFEGVAYALRDCQEAVRETGTILEEVFAIGGGAQSEYWLHVVATVLDTRLNVPKGQEFGAAMGAARLALCGATGVSPHSIMTPPQIDRTIEPDLSLKPAFDAAYANYTSLYPTLKRLSQ